MGLTMSLLTENNIIEDIKELNRELEQQFEEVQRVETALTRKIVSFQDNKSKPFYRWYKYKEAFSASLVHYLLEKYRTPSGKIFDPFAGIGTTLFASASLGYDSEGIELLPVGQVIIQNRAYAEFKISSKDIAVLKKWKNKQPWNQNVCPKSINSLRITQGAYPPETEIKIGKYLSELEKENHSIANLLFFALICVLEIVSYTRKDGQYLRWDYRSGRGNGQNKFNKGKIWVFDEAIFEKIKQILFDIEHPQGGDLFATQSNRPGKIHLHKGSCLDVLPTLENNYYQAIITSPPYCNRYDYTRTYALEHAILGIGEEGLIKLRQAMVSCTVENRPKELGDFCSSYDDVSRIFQKQDLINTIIDFLEQQKKNKNLNNNGIPRMVKGYFYEMTAVILECHRVLKHEGFLFMVNDNVRYAGMSIPVDLILSKIAQDIGFINTNILVLPQSKGNSSQQMGDYGKEALRKCVYVWRKP